MFKKGDLVRAIDVGSFESIILNKIYIVDRVDISNDNFLYLDINSKTSGGFFPRRFKKVSAKDLTEKEKFEYIKYKLGIKKENN